jgi:hypothetical protein
LSVFIVKNIFLSCRDALAYYKAGAVDVNSRAVGLAPGANPTIVCYNASAVKIYNATSSLVRFENINIFIYSPKMV